MATPSLRSENTIDAWRVGDRSDVAVDVSTSSEMGYAGRHPLAIVDVVGAVGGHRDRGELLLVGP